MELALHAVHIFELSFHLNLYSLFRYMERFYPILWPLFVQYIPLPADPVMHYGILTSLSVRRFPAIVTLAFSLACGVVCNINLLDLVCLYCNSVQGNIIVACFGIRLDACDDLCFAAVLTELVIFVVS